MTQPCRFLYLLFHALPELRMKCSCIPVSRRALAIYLSSKEHSTSAPASCTPHSSDNGQVTVENRPMKVEARANTTVLHGERLSHHMGSVDEIKRCYVLENICVAERKQVCGGDCFCVPCPSATRTLGELL